MGEINYKCVLFCEDIRHETGGRISLMGVLGTKLFVQEFPILFPKLCLFLEWGEIKGTYNVKLNIVPPEGISLPKVSPSASITGQPGLIARSMIILNGFVFPAPGTYFFEFWIDDKCVGREPFTIIKYETPGSKATN